LKDQDGSDYWSHPVLGVRFFEDAKTGRDVAAIGEAQRFYGLVHHVGEGTGDMLIKCWKVSQTYGQEAMIPKLKNPAGARLGDKVSFEVLEGAEGARPLAVLVQVTGHVHIAPEDSGYSNEVRRQVLYYLSDENLVTDQFFQDVMAKNDGWLPMSTILSCARMKQMQATCQSVFAAVRDATHLIKLKEGPPGEEAVARTTPSPPLMRTTPPPPLMSKGVGKGQNLQPWAPTGNQPAAKVLPKPPTPTAATLRPSKDDRFYAGKVKAQMRVEPYKLFISCDEIVRAYGCDAFFLPNAKPSSVSEGSLIVFTVPEDSEIGVPPQANFVAELAHWAAWSRRQATAECPAPTVEGLGSNKQ